LPHLALAGFFMNLSRANAATPTSNAGARAHNIDSRLSGMPASRHPKTDTPAIAGISNGMQHNTQAATIAAVGRIIFVIVVSSRNARHGALHFTLCDLK
jgi:hypothetical protein